MSDALIQSLQQQLADANRKLSNRTEQAKRYKQERDAARTDLQTITSERDTAATERDSAVSERDTARGTPDAKDQRIAELEGTIRTRDHKDAFRKLAQGKVREDAIDDLYTLSGYTAEGDIDETRIGELIGAAVTARPFLAPTAAATATTPADKGAPIQTPRATPGPGSGRGVIDPPASATAVVGAGNGSRPAGRIA